MISIIIPTLNEEKTIANCLISIRDQPESHEIVVVDGGSTDNTAAIVRGFSEVKLLRMIEKGRWRQMNRGAMAAEGQILLFLHADTQLPEGGLGKIKAQMAQTRVVAGSFSLSFDHASPLLRLFARFSRINLSLFTYGDQGLFVTRRTFQYIGGFAEIPLMEDVEIQKRLRRLGRFVKVDQSVVTSSRRFLSSGIVRQQLLNTGLVLLYHAGVSPYRLKRYYP